MTPEKIGRYQITSTLGRGGFAVVYLGNDPFVKRQVAIKVLPSQFTDTAAMRARFQQEAEIIAALEHPAIVPIYDYGEHQGQPFIVMRYMSGGSLAERINEGPMGTAEAAKILKRIGSALDRAHDQGIIHRDIKPGNILFDQYGDAYLSDFGIARLTEASLQLTGGGAIGTPAYMSPEQVYGDRPVDGRSDVYALGIILFEMLTGSIPYEADTPAKLMMKHVLEPVPRILAVKPDLPPAYEDILGRALAKEPNKRYAKATDFTSAVTVLSPTKPGIQPPTTNQSIAQPAPKQEKPHKTVEETILDTPTPPEVRRVIEPTHLAAEPAPAAYEDTKLATPLPAAQQAAPTGKGRPSWLIPAAAAGGVIALIIVIVLIIFIASNLLGGPDTTESPIDNSASASTADQTDSTSAIDNFP
jgi:serine/threonine protein kinase